MKNLFTILTILIIAAGCGGSDNSEKLKDKIVFNKSEVDVLIDFEPTSAVFYNGSLIFVGKDNTDSTQILIWDIENNNRNKPLEHHFFNNELEYLRVIGNELTNEIRQKGIWWKWDGSWSVDSTICHYEGYSCSRIVELFNNDEFQVFKYDMGEWGGTLNFIDKKTNQL